MFRKIVCAVLLHPCIPRLRVLEVACIGYVLSATTPVFAMQAAIPLKDKVAGSDLIVVAEVTQVATQRVMHCTFSATNLGSEPVLLCEEQMPTQEALDYLAELSRTRDTLRDQGNRYGETALTELREHYGLEMEARCRVKSVFKGNTDIAEASVRFLEPVDGYTVVPSPWTFKAGSTYLFFLTSENGTFALFHKSQGARLVAREYRELDEDPDGLPAMRNLAHDELATRIAEFQIGQPQPDKSHAGVNHDK